MKIVVYGPLPELSALADFIDSLTGDAYEVVMSVSGTETANELHRVLIYGPLPMEGKAIAELLRHIPDWPVTTVVQAPPRRAVDLRPCQRPGVLEYTASVDNRMFIHLSQPTKTSPYKVVIT